MAKQDQKFVELVAKLIELTQESSLTWKLVETSKISAPGFTKNVGAAFQTTYKDKRLRIYKREYDYTEENYLYGALAYQPSYSISIELAIVDASGNPIWTFPRVTGLSDLYEAIAYRVAGVDEFLEKALSPSDEASNK